MDKKIEPYKGISNIYDEIRPSYPEQLIKDIISRTGINLNERLLEIGAGTGKATVQFAEKGFSVHAIEIGEDMADILKVKCAMYPKVSIDVDSFEEWSCSTNQKYDMIYSAQAFHWLDTSIKYKKCHELLKDDGYLVLFWYNPCNTELHETNEIDQKVDEIINKYTTNQKVDNRKPERRAHSGISKDDERKAEIEESGLFRLIEKIDYTQETRNNALQYILAKKSIPAFASILDNLDNKTIENIENEIEEVIASYGGFVSTLFNFSLYISKKM